MATLPTVGATTAQDSPSHSGQHNTTADDHNYFYVNGPDKTAVNQAPGGGTGSRHTIFEGAAATPVTSNVNSTLVVSRYSAMTAASSANAAAITAVNVDHGTLTQAVGVHAEAEQVNTGDACGSLAFATIAATASISGGHTPTAYGAFGAGITELTTGHAVGGNFVVQTVSDKTFLGDGGTDVTSGVFVQCAPINAGPHLMGVAVLIESADNTKAYFDVGIGFYAGSVVTTGIDMTQLTLSDSYIKFDANFKVQLSGTDPAFTFDAGGDAFVYTRSNNAYNFLVGGSTIMELASGFLQIPNLPTVDPGISGTFWNASGVVHYHP